MVVGAFARPFADRRHGTAIDVRHSWITSIATFFEALRNCLVDRSSRRRVDGTFA